MITKVRLPRRLRSGPAGRPVRTPDPPAPAARRRRWLTPAVVLVLLVLLWWRLLAAGPAWDTISYTDFVATPRPAPPARAV